MNPLEGVAGSIALKFIERRLKQGHSIEIPSLGLTISASDTKWYTDNNLEVNKKVIPIGTTSCGGLFRWNGVKWTSSDEDRNENK